MREELGVTPVELRASSELSFQFVDGFAMHVFVFAATRCEGELRETSEARPVRHEPALVRRILSHREVEGRLNARAVHLLELEEDLTLWAVDRASRTRRRGVARVRRGVRAASTRSSAASSSGTIIHPHTESPGTSPELLEASRPENVVLKASV